MHQEQRDRAQLLLAERGVERALFASPASVTWLTGFALSPQLGPSIFSGGPPLLWYHDGRWTLVVLESLAEEAARSGCEVLSYPGYSIQRPIAGAADLAAALRHLLAPALASGRAVGVEAQHLPAFLHSLVGALLPASGALLPIDGVLTPLRAVKSADELRQLRHSFALTDIGHATARSAVQAGQREIDVWAAVHGAIQQAAGQRVPLGNDCISGRRQANIGGWPTELALEPGDSCIVDLSVVLGGYWSDSCATYYAGEPSPQQVDMHLIVAEALQFAISLVRPGAVTGEIDRQVRRFMADTSYNVYPHHTGHGVGVTSHEEPRIVPYNDMQLAPGMIVMLEPGIYLPGITSVRLEDAVLVTSDGGEVLTNHDKRLP